jgi:hypothetical protein
MPWIYGKFLPKKCLPIQEQIVTAKKRAFPREKHPVPFSRFGKREKFANINMATIRPRVRLRRLARLVLLSLHALNRSERWATTIFLPIPPVGILRWKDSWLRAKKLSKKALKYCHYGMCSLISCICLPVRNE